MGVFTSLSHLGHTRSLQGQNVSEIPKLDMTSRSRELVFPERNISGPLEEGKLNHMGICVEL